MREFISTVLIFGGIFFFIVGTIGVIRLPDALTRAHGAAKCDTLGALLTLLGLVVLGGGVFTDIKLILAIVFIWITSPTSTHLIARAIVARSDRDKEA